MSDEAAQWRTIGERLRQAREYLELKQEEAAEAVGLSRSALSLVENGRRKVDAVELSRFAQVYGQSIEALTGTAETPPLPKACTRWRERPPSCRPTIAPSCSGSPSSCRRDPRGEPIVARTPVEEARLQAVAAAKRVHRALDLQQRVVEAGGQVDVFDAIAELDIALIFKPLKSALGLCLPQPLRGIMVTTERSLHIQRITAAHELGHVILEHRGSIDREILERGPFGPSQGRDIQEVEADAFAAEFLLPRWLYRHHVQTRAGRSAHLRNPEIVYQLSLRMGASYEATCWGLLGHQILPRGDVDALRKAKVAKLKLGLG